MEFSTIQTQRLKQNFRLPSGRHSMLERSDIQPYCVLCKYLKSCSKLQPGLHKVSAVLTVRFVEEDEGIFIRGKYDVFHGGGDNIQHQLS